MPVSIYRFLAKIRHWLTLGIILLNIWVIAVTVTNYPVWIDSYPLSHLNYFNLYVVWGLRFWPLLVLDWFLLIFVFDPLYPPD